MLTASPGMARRALALIALLFGGGAVGGLLASIFAPESLIADVVSFFAFPAAFIAALQFSHGAVLAGLAWRRTRGAVRDRSRETALPALKVSATAFFVLGTVSGFMAGVIVGALSATHSFLEVLATYTGSGMMYGWISGRVARAGWFFPDG